MTGMFYMYIYLNISWASPLPWDNNANCAYAAWFICLLEVLELFYKITIV